VLNLLTEAIMKTLITRSKAALLIAPLVLLVGCATSEPFSKTSHSTAQASITTQGGQLAVNSIKSVADHYVLSVSTKAQHPSYSECDTALVTTGQDRFQVDADQSQQYTKSDYNVMYDLTLSNAQMQKLAANDSLNVQLCAVQYSVSKSQITDLQAKFLAVTKANTQTKG
jgi:hypothetical protein